MTERINGRPLWRLVFDAEGDVDAATLSALRDGVAAEALTDLVLFSHGWNNDEGAAQSLYARWFALLADQLDPARTVGFVGIRWPSQLWRDEPIPDFDTTPAPRGGGGAAGLDGPALIEVEPVTIDPAELADLKDMFPDGSAHLDAIAALLEKPPTAQRAQQMFDELRLFGIATAAGCDDGEHDAPAPVPGMLDTQREPVDVFNRFADRLADAGVQFDGGGGAAGLGDLGSRIWHGAKEVLRQLSYWKMKNRAGVVGRNGLGPAIDDLVGARPDLRIHLVGHSFGARLVSFALDGITERSPSPVKSVTLLQGAFSRFTFTKGLPFRDGDGALVGRLARIDGPMAVCFSSHDRALGTFYPLASLTARDDAAGLDDPMARWRAMGALGAFRCDTQSLGQVGAEYPFAPGQILNLDSSEVVVADAGPSGAHSDIFHSELSWVAAAAGKLLPG